MVIDRKTSSYEHVFNFEWLPRWSCLDVQLQSKVEVHKKVKLLTVTLILIHLMSEWHLLQFTVNVPKIPPPT